MLGFYVNLYDVDILNDETYLDMTVAQHNFIGCKISWIYFNT